MQWWVSNILQQAIWYPVSPEGYLLVVVASAAKSDGARRIVRIVARCESCVDVINLLVSVSIVCMHIRVQRGLFSHNLHQGLIYMLDANGSISLAG